MKIALIFVIVGCTMGGCSYLNRKVGVGDDHLLEELLEHYIEQQTGLDIDLSHETPEK